MVPAVLAILLFFRPSGMISRLLHLTVDAVLVSASLAGIRRSTGLTFDTEKIKNEEVKSAISKYLGVGEWTLDSTVAFLGTSGWFRRDR